ncbi:MAG: type II toxin-antitoxin system RelE/ParE family toxin [Simkaniaceae bacterium]|nr:type II toxin-antitoxin system RelE/ParE family toxin [Candidatus Sacchlamyda saccharinae]
MEIQIRYYEASSGKSPFTTWVEGLKEKHTRAKIFTRIDRFRFGNFGDCKSVGDGVYELRVHYGPGIRIYYSKIGNKIVLLLCGGDKSTQNKDINKAKEYLRDYESQGGIDGEK